MSTTHIRSNEIAVLIPARTSRAIGSTRTSTAPVAQTNRHSWNSVVFSFVRGLGQTLSLFPRAIHSTPADDWDALTGDWSAIGCDLDSAIDQLDASELAHASA